jgi:hypothetical protein
MRGGQRVELVWQREHEVAVRHVQQFAQPCLTPSLARLGLALRAVPVSAGVPAPLLAAAVVAAQQLPPRAAVRQLTMARQAFA